MAESDFSNGFLLAELLSKYNQQPGFPEEFRDTDNAEDKIGNFDALQNSLKTLGIRFAANDADDIMNCKRGAVLRLLYQIKMVIDKIALTQKPGVSCFAFVYFFRDI